MKFALVLLALLSAFMAQPGHAARDREPTVHAAFVPTPVVATLGAKCPPPCFVHLDASTSALLVPGKNENGEPIVTHDSVTAFRDFDFAWDCGNGTVARWPINACRYDAPGDFAITLRVTGIDGETAFAAQKVHVDKPTDGVRVVFEPGERRDVARLPSGPYVVTTKSGGARGVIVGDVALRSGQVIAGVDIEGGVQAQCGARGVALADSTVRMPASRPAVVRQPNGSWVNVREQLWSSPYGCRTMNDLAVLWGVRLEGDQGRVAYIRNARMVIRHSDFDGGQPATKISTNDGVTVVDCARSECPNGYDLRTVNFERSAIVETKIHRPAQRANPIQLRSWGQGGANEPPSRDNEWIVLADLDLRALSPGSAFIRTCQGSTCTDSNVSETVDLRRVRIEDALMTVEQGGSLGPAVAVWYQGGEVWMRRITVDLRGVASLPSRLTFAAQAASSTRPKPTPGARTEGGSLVARNTLIGAPGRQVTWLSPLASARGNVVEGNRAE